MKAKLLGVAALAVVLLASQAKAVTYTLNATLIETDTLEQRQLYNLPLEIVNGQIVSPHIYGFVASPPGSWSQGPIAPDLWHLHTDALAPAVNPTVTNCIIGCSLDLIFEAPGGTLIDYKGGPILSLAFFYSLQGCGIPAPGMVTSCTPIISERFTMIAGTGTIHQTPIPGALPLFATGLGLLGLLRWRSKRALAKPDWQSNPR